MVKQNLFSNCMESRFNKMLKALNDLSLFNTNNKKKYSSVLRRKELKLSVFQRHLLVAKVLNYIEPTTRNQ